MEGEIEEDGVREIERKKEEEEEKNRKNKRRTKEKGFLTSTRSVWKSSFDATAKCILR